MEGDILFQFLIGSLKSKFPNRGNSLFERFQFLIGSLKSSLNLALRIKKILFQFLIGSLKSEWEPPIPEAE
mgnify:CR=1 FL=1